MPKEGLPVPGSPAQAHYFKKSTQIRGCDIINITNFAKVWIRICNHKKLGSSKIAPNFVHNNLDMFTVSVIMKPQDI
jgi:hypothetical protein